MKLQLDIQIKRPSSLITFSDSIFLIGSCFTGNIGVQLSQLKFNTIHNPTGILFDPKSIATHLEHIVSGKTYTESDTFYMNEVCSSWLHHSDFNGMTCDECINLINEATQRAHLFLLRANKLVITLGSAFHYVLADNDMPVANCHRAPSAWFTKKLIRATEVADMLRNAITAVRKVNPDITVIFTVSPVRHIRDGVVENNLSKAQLITAVHQLCDELTNLHYFPAYEIVVDVLRDYRFYDIDMVHPNYLATQIVADYFLQNYFDERTRAIIPGIKQLTTAMNHRPRNPLSMQHKQFLQIHLDLCRQLQQKLPHLNFNNEQAYFST
ncbi:MAG: GSCFA domain-containing protein [Bacteroidetes bacterium]|nr:GSCFA domain-containing protein [Bacteroidota bacterium]